MRIGEVPMKCMKCGCERALDDCNRDDPFGDGSFGCPVPDCGGAMKQDESKIKRNEITGMYELL